MNMKRRDGIDTLNIQIREMTELVADQVKRAADAASSGNARSAASVEHHDLTVIRYGILIEEECLKLLGITPPLEDERRYVFSASKVKHELVCIGKLARRVAHESRLLGPGGLPATARDMALLADIAARSCTGAIHAFITRNVQATKTVWDEVPTLDDIYTRLCTRFEAAFDQPGVRIPSLLAARTMASSLARVGGHASRIANMVATVQPAAPLSP